MELTRGLRLSSGGRTTYEIVGPAWSSPRNEFHRARKVVWNFRYPATALDEAGPDEWLDVLVRRPTADRPESERFEREVLFALPFAGWFLEPLDHLELEPGDRPLLVLADPHAEQLAMGPPPDARAAERLLVMADGILGMLDEFHHEGLVAGHLDPDDFLVDGEGRWFYLGTDRIQEAKPDRPPAGDLVEWANLVARLLGGRAQLGTFEAVARAVHPDLIDWVRRGLEEDPKRRPASVAELRSGRRGFLHFDFLRRR